MLAGVEGRDVQPDQRGPARQQRARSGGEVLQPRAHRQDHVCVPRQGVGGRGPGHADGANGLGMVPRHRTLARLGFRHGDSVPGGEGLQRVRRSGVQHAAASDDQGPARVPEQAGGAGQVRRVGAGPARAMQPGREERFGIVAGLGLHVLAQAERGRAAIRRVGEDGDRAGQGDQQLLRTGDAVPVARHRLEAVVHAGGGVAGRLKLLQHRVGPAAGEHVAGQEQHRQPVDVGDPRRRQQVHRSRADRGGDGHHLPPVPRLCIGHGGQRHALLVVPAEGGEGAARAMQRFAHAGDIAVAEDSPAAGEQRRLRPVVQQGALGREVAHDGLRRGEADGAGAHAAASCSAASPAGATRTVPPVLRLSSAASARRSASRPSAKPASGAAPPSTHSMN